MNNLYNLHNLRPQDKKKELDIPKENKPFFKIFTQIKEYATKITKNTHENKTSTKEILKTLKELQKDVKENKKNTQQIKKEVATFKPQKVDTTRDRFNARMQERRANKSKSSFNAGTTGAKTGTKTGTGTEKTGWEKEHPYLNKLKKKLITYFFGGLFDKEFWAQQKTRLTDYIFGKNTKEAFSAFTGWIKKKRERRAQKREQDRAKQMPKPFVFSSYKDEDIEENLAQSNLSSQATPATMQKGSIFDELNGASASGNAQTSRMNILYAKRKQEKQLDEILENVKELTAESKKNDEGLLKKLEQWFMDIAIIRKTVQEIRKGYRALKNKFTKAKPNMKTPKISLQNVKKGSIFSRAGKWIKKGVSKFGGTMLGLSVGSKAGPWGAIAGLIGGVILDLLGEKIIEKIAGLFTKDKEENYIPSENLQTIQATPNPNATPVDLNTSPIRKNTNLNYTPTTEAKDNTQTLKKESLARTTSNNAQNNYANSNNTSNTINNQSTVTNINNNIVSSDIPNAISDPSMMVIHSN